MRFSLLTTAALLCLSSFGITQSFTPRDAEPEAAVIDGLGSAVAEAYELDKRNAAAPVYYYDALEVRAADHQAKMDQHHKVYKAAEKEYYRHAATQNTAKNAEHRKEAAKQAAAAAKTVVKHRKYAESHAKQLGINDAGHAHQIKEWQGKHAQQLLNSQKGAASKKANPGGKNWHAGGSKKGNKGRH